MFKYTCLAQLGIYLSERTGKAISNFGTHLRLSLNPLDILTFQSTHVCGLAGSLNRQIPTKGRYVKETQLIVEAQACSRTYVELFRLNNKIVKVEIIRQPTYDNYSYKCTYICQLKYMHLKYKNWYDVSCIIYAVSQKS